MAQIDLSSAVGFRYRTPDGREYSIEGSAAQPPDSRKPLWLSFVLRVHSLTELGTRATKWFLTSSELGDNLKAQSQLDDQALRAKWSPALRQYAVKQTIVELDSGTISDSDCKLTWDHMEALGECLYRACDFRKSSNGDLICP